MFQVKYFCYRDAKCFTSNGKICFAICVLEKYYTWILYKYSTNFTDQNSSEDVDKVFSGYQPR
jgi:hypothetical protein